MTPTPNSPCVHQVYRRKQTQGFKPVVWDQCEDPPTELQRMGWEYASQKLILGSYPKQLSLNRNSRGEMVGLIGIPGVLCYIASGAEREVWWFMLQVNLKQPTTIDEVFECM